MSEGKSAFFSGLTIALTAALVAGLFTLVPVVFDYTSNRQGIRYWVNSSLVLNTEPNRQMFFVEIENTGSKSTEDILFDFHFDSAQLADLSIEAPSGVDSTELLVPDRVSVSISELNPGEVAKISFMATGDLLNGEPDARVRARGVPVDRVENAPGGQEGYSRAKIFLFLTLYLIVGVGAVRNLFPTIRRVLFGHLGTLDREVALAYIRRLVLTEDESSFVPATTTYMEAADAVFLAAKRGFVRDSAARAFLLCLQRCDDRMAPATKATLVRNLEILGSPISAGGSTSSLRRTSDIRSDFDKIAEEALVTPLALEEKKLANDEKTS